MTRLFTTCPPSSAYSAEDYATRVAEVSRWSEEAGAEGALIYTDNRLVDPWSVAQLMIGATRRLVPLVAVQPVYMPPFTLAKRIASLAFLTRRRVALNLVAGGFVRDLAALGDATAHDERYARLEEYATIALSLLRGEEVRFEGRHYTLDGATLSPETPADLLPEIMVSGSSEAGAAVAASLGALPVTYPAPPQEAADAPALGGPGRRIGARIGVIARETREEAWAIAHARFPADPRGRLLHTLAMAHSDSDWHARLSASADRAGRAEPGEVYWLHPFRTYKTFCPYLVGSHDEVAAALRIYLERGVTDVILDVPMTREDLPNTTEVFRRAACARAAADSSPVRA